MKKKKITYINIKDIKADFTDETEPKDEKLLKLLQKAYSGKLLCYRALIKFEGIKPFSDYKPDISEKYRKNFQEKLKEKKYPEIYVYPEKGKFIMSDDYNTYYLYKEYNFPEVLCFVLGEPKGKYVVEKSKPFFHPMLKAEIID